MIIEIIISAPKLALIAEATKIADEMKQSIGKIPVSIGNILAISSPVAIVGAF
jgi:hypothetical protein